MNQIQIRNLENRNEELIKQIKINYKRKSKIFDKNNINFLKKFDKNLINIEDYFKNDYILNKKNKNLLFSVKDIKKEKLKYIVELNFLNIKSNGIMIAIKKINEKENRNRKYN